MEQITAHPSKKAAIFGTGIAGLTVAHELARRGWLVSVYEPNAEAGGLFVVRDVWSITHGTLATIKRSSKAFITPLSMIDGRRSYKRLRKYLRGSRRQSCIGRSVHPSVVQEVRPLLTQPGVEKHLAGSSR